MVRTMIDTVVTTVNTVKTVVVEFAVFRCSRELIFWVRGRIWVVR